MTPDALSHPTRTMEQVRDELRRKLLEGATWTRPPEPRLVTMLYNLECEIADRSSRAAALRAQARSALVP